MLAFPLNVSQFSVVAREHLEIDETREEMIKKPEAMTGTHHHLWAETMRKHRVRKKAEEWDDERHAGCQISGFLWVSKLRCTAHHVLVR